MWTCHETSFIKYINWMQTFDSFLFGIIPLSLITLNILSQFILDWKQRNETKIYNVMINETTLWISCSISMHYSKHCTDHSTMMKPRCPSLLRPCKVLWASCSLFRFWFNSSIWFWREEMRTAADVSTCCMKPASSTSRQRRSSPNSFLTTHFRTSDSFWLNKQHQILTPFDCQLWQIQILFSDSESELRSVTFQEKLIMVLAIRHCNRSIRVHPDYSFRNTQQLYKS